MAGGYSCKATAPTEAEILIYEDVGDSFFGGVTAKQFASDLAGLGPVKTINLRIASLGGDVNEGLAIYRRLVDHPANVIAHIDGFAASIASVIAMAGNEIRIAEASALMIHDAWAYTAGNAKDLRSLADRLDATSGAIADVYVARTGKPLDQVKAWMADETWFYGQEAVDAGFATSVVENMKIAARYNAALHKFRNAPAALAAPAGSSPAARPMLDAARQAMSQRMAKLTRSRLPA